MRAVKIVMGLAVITAAGLGSDLFLAAASISVAQAAPPVPAVLAQVEQGSGPITPSDLGTVEALNSAVVPLQVTGVAQRSLPARLPGLPPILSPSPLFGAASMDGKTGS